MMLTTSVFELRLKSCDAAVRDRDLQGFGTKNFKSDGHLITGDSVFPNYSAWRRSQTESLLSRRPLFYLFLPLAPRFVRALGAPRTAHYATPPLGAGAV